MNKGIDRICRLARGLVPLALALTLAGVAAVPLFAQKSLTERVTQEKGKGGGDEGGGAAEAMEGATELLESAVDGIVGFVHEEEKGGVHSPRWNSLTSPRDALFTFHEAMGHAEQGREAGWERALKTLDLSETDGDEEVRRKLAEQLKEVLDRLEPIRPIDLPGTETLRENDLRRFVFFPRSDHGWVWEELSEPPKGKIVLVEKESGRWLFSAGTVAGIPDLHESLWKLPPQKAEEPSTDLANLLGPTFERTEWWEWLVLLGSIFIALFLGRLVKRAICKAADKIAPETSSSVGATLLQGLANPVSLALFTSGLAIGLSFLYFEPTLSEFRWDVIRFLLIIVLGFLLFNAIELIGALIRKIARQTGSQLDDMAVPLVVRSLRIFLGVLLTIFVIQNIFHWNITGFITGLGIAGLALSLAAKDSVQNLFGSLTIFFDKPFQVGDLIKFNDSFGTVESIGLRSTRIRLLSGHLVTEPNMKFIDTKVENVSARPYIRREMNLAIVYGTPLEKVRKALEILRSTLSEDQEIVEEGAFDLEEHPPEVSFNEFGEWSLNLRVYYWYRLGDGDDERNWYTYLRHCSKVNETILERFNEAGIPFAFPTRTLHVDEQAPPFESPVSADSSSNGKEHPGDRKQVENRPQEQTR